MREESLTLGENKYNTHHKVANEISGKRKLKAKLLTEKIQKALQKYENEKTKRA
jgi:hypothetical protein